ncbi:predicted protein [Naegleria gruberi]|uniref:Predicted protein n=1 Tax=Naegleria gruberi TaxID=5762 RepID=D2VMZ1_NAEGR|nr:uncharacterized protein NAEGRDRAFT_70313 [Naegleria gruberi]EFC41827.1 predicted protein [Naegleria gruberi]|eukprot:XP_002674571.1 predicted protein [Naegleria gruberi strain NEG-M]
MSALSPLIIPVISNIANISQYLQEDNDSKNLQLKFVNYSNPIEVLNSGFEIIVADGYLLTPEFWQAFHHQLEKGESSLKWINCTFAGVNAIFENIRKTTDSSKLIQLLIENNIRLTKIGVFGSHMFEYLIQHMMNELRHYEKVLDHQSQSLWVGKTAFNYKTLDRVKIGLLGYGNIGKYICETFKKIYPTIKIHIYRNSQKSYKLVHNAALLMLEEEI